MGSVEGKAEESGLGRQRQSYYKTTRQGRLAKAGFGVHDLC
jgi:hypothetical protein